MENNIETLLEYIDPSGLTYEEWTEVGMAIKHEGLSVDVWDSWSRRDFGRYHSGECAKKWSSFNGSAAPVTGGTLYQMAVQGGYVPQRGHELDWDSPIDADEQVISYGQMDIDDLPTVRADWNPAGELITYLETLFQRDEVVGYVIKSTVTDKGKFVPANKGVYTKTAGEIIDQLVKYKNLPEAIGDSDPEAGAWIRFNPLDGKGVKNENVTEFRYALVESDTMTAKEQAALIRALELPVAVMVFSGSKSVHAIVKVDAADYAEYKKRVDYLYGVCEKNGMVIDKQNRNPSRLSRMPGAVRGDKHQYIIDRNFGQPSWDAWYEYIEKNNDDLPEIEGLSDEWDHIPELAPALIEGVLRTGHKMLISGPSKAGKSFALIELCIAIAEGQRWLGWSCMQGKVLYVNLEIDKASCLHRFRDVYQTLGIPAQNLANIDLWNLRGRSMQMDALAPKLIRRAMKRNYLAIIIDPIYKVITGDENSADQMARFCNQFDTLCTELGCAVIYCHHHSKGAQGGKKAIDRASGSGVFTRDPDAIIDMIELELSDEVILQNISKSVCSCIDSYLTKNKLYDENEPGLDDKMSPSVMRNYAENLLESGPKSWHWDVLKAQLDAAEKAARAMTGWRIEGSLREFAAFDPINIWFRYPAHYLDSSGALKDLESDSPIQQLKKLNKARKEKAKEDRDAELIGFGLAFDGLADEDGKVYVKDIAEQIGKSESSIRTWFGNGKSKERKDYKKEFELCRDTGNGPAYLVRKRSSELEKDDLDDL